MSNDKIAGSKTKQINIQFQLPLVQISFVNPTKYVDREDNKNVYTIRLLNRST